MTLIAWYPSSAAKLDSEIVFYGTLERFLGAWHKIEGEKWTTASSLYAGTFSEVHLQNLHLEHSRLPELFYSTTGLPVITPANYKQFLSMASGTQFKLWTWFAGRS